MFRSWLLNSVALLLLCSTVHAAKRPETAVEDLPAPFNLQAITLKKTITLNWEWQPPVQKPDFTDFGYEVQRSDGKSRMASATTYSDFDLAIGTYSYRVRVRGGSKEHGKRVLHVSAWSEPAGGEVVLTCGGTPSISLLVEPTKRQYSEIPSLKLRLTGDVHVPTGCTLTGLRYRVDLDNGLHNAGDLKAGPNGHFDNVVEALGRDDEIPEGQASFTITATAEDELGPVTSSAYTITMEMENRFAPKQGY